MNITWKRNRTLVVAGLMLWGLATLAQSAEELAARPYRTGAEKRVDNPVDAWMLAHSGPGGKPVEGPAKYKASDGWAGRYEILDA